LDESKKMHGASPENDRASHSPSNMAEVESTNAAAAEAKARGNALFAKKTKSDLAAALDAYTEAVGHTPANHILVRFCINFHCELQHVY
jgi:hypothetical protein